jgi:tricorn protease-like protein
VDRLRRLVTLGFAAAVALALGLPGTASAAFPGTNGKIVFERNYDIWSIAPDGSSAQNLSNTPISGSPGILEQYPDVSPDGQHIVFTASAQGTADSLPHVYVMNADGTNRVQITTGNDYQPQWSPDGSQIAFTRNGSAIWVMNADGSNQHSIVSSQSETPSWSPDGSKIAFGDLSTGTWQISTIAPNGSNRQQLTTGPGVKIFPDWSPDGTRIAFDSDQLCAPFCYQQIWAMNADGSGLTQLTTQTAADAQNPVWSPDGTRIAFVNAGPQGGNHHLYSMNPDGTGIVTLTTDAGSGDANEAQIDWGRSPTQQPAILSDASTSAGIHVPFDFKILTSGAPTPLVTETGALPTGVTLTDNGDGTADLAGTAAVGSAASYPITITATNGVGAPATQSFVLQVSSSPTAPGFIAPAADTEAFGVAFSYTVRSTGYPVPKVTKTGALPAGVTFTSNADGTATIAGTAGNAAAGVYVLTLTAKSSAGTASETFSLTITRAPTINHVPTVNDLVGTAMNPLTITAAGYEKPALTLSGPLPSGLTFTDNGNGTATLSGTPDGVSNVGVQTLTVTATNSHGVATQAFTVNANQLPAITSTNSANATIGQAFSFQVTTTGFPAPKLTRTGTLPKGIVWDATTGTFSGVAKAKTAGSYVFTLTAKNKVGTATQTFTIVVS